MNDTVQSITIIDLAFALAPVLAVVVILQRWSVGSRTSLYATARMLIQLLLVGYVLAFVFQTDRAMIVVGVLTIMLAAASWIALRPIAQIRRRLWLRAFIAIGIGSGVTLAWMTQLVISIDPWFWPRYLIPLAGMAFSNAMNAVSLAAERYESERGRDITHGEARRKALGAALIPLTNSLFAAGLVSFPGMMTGQILSGISPLLAARYQIMVMCLVFGSAGLATAAYLFRIERGPIQAA